MSKEVSLISYDKEIEAIGKYEHYHANFHNTFGDIRSLHVRLTPLVAECNAKMALIGLLTMRTEKAARPKDILRLIE